MMFFAPLYSGAFFRMAWACGRKSGFNGLLRLNAAEEE